MKKLLITLFVFVCAAVAVRFGSDSWKSHKIAQAQQQENDRLELVRQAAKLHARSIIQKSLKDPSSAQWQGERLSTDDATLCGEVNARNSLGGYVGFKRFIAGPKGHLIEGAHFNSWSMTDNKTPVPDYMVKAAELIDEGAMQDDLGDVFAWFWKNNCL